MRKRLTLTFELSGLFAPTFLLGALIGRTYYILVQYIHDEAYGLSQNFTSPIYEGGEYAVIGAAALTGGITRAISTAIIAVELTGQGALTLPQSTAVVIAYFTANRLAPSV